MFGGGAGDGAAVGTGGEAGDVDETSMFDEAERYVRGHLRPLASMQWLASL
jgi:hypothetical protein